MHKLYPNTIPCDIRTWVPADFHTFRGPWNNLSQLSRGSCIHMNHIFAHFIKTLEDLINLDVGRETRADKETYKERECFLGQINFQGLQCLGMRSCVKTKSQKQCWLSLGEAGTRLLEPFLLPPELVSRELNSGPGAGCGTEVLYCGHKQLLCWTNHPVLIKKKLPL